MKKEDLIDLIKEKNAMIAKLVLVFMPTDKWQGVGLYEDAMEVFRKGGFNDE